MTALVYRRDITDESWGRGASSAAADLLRPVAVCHVLAGALAGEVRDARPAPGLGVGLGDRDRQIPALHRAPRKAMDRFEEAFWSGQSLEELYKALSQRPVHSMAALFVAAMREWKRSFEARRARSPACRSGSRR